MTETLQKPSKKPVEHLLVKEKIKTEAVKATVDHPRFLAMFKKMSLKGHTLTDSAERTKNSREFRMGIKKLGLPTLLKLRVALDSGRVLGDNQSIDLGLFGLTCRECGKSLPQYTDGMKIWLAPPCECPKKDPQIFELNVPSGKLAYGPRMLIFGSVMNTSIMPFRHCLIRHSRSIEKRGCIALHVNFSNTVLQRFGDDNKFMLSWTVAGALTGEIPSAESGHCVFADAEEYHNRRQGIIDPDILYADVKPGVYRFSHSFKTVTAGINPSQAITHIEWVRDPDPPTDYFKHSREANFTAEQIIAWRIHQRPDKYRGPNAVFEAVKSLMTDLTSVTDSWHSNGFGPYDSSMPANFPEVKIPRFAAKYPWGTLDEFSVIATAAGFGDDGGRPLRLNPSFLKLARSILRCITHHGSSGEEPEATEKRARDCLAALDKLYDDRVKKKTDRVYSRKSLWMGISRRQI